MENVAKKISENLEALPSITWESGSRKITLKVIGARYWAPRGDAGPQRVYIDTHIKGDDRHAPQGLYWDGEELMYSYGSFCQSGRKQRNLDLEIVDLEIAIEKLLEEPEPDFEAEADARILEEDENLLIDEQTEADARLLEADENLLIDEQPRHATEPSPEPEPAAAAAAAEPILAEQTETTHEDEDDEVLSSITRVMEYLTGEQVANIDHAQDAVRDIELGIGARIYVSGQDHARSCPAFEGDELAEDEWLVQRDSSCFGLKATNSIGHHIRFDLEGRPVRPRTESVLPSSITTTLGELAAHYGVPLEDGLEEHDEAVVSIYRDEEEEWHVRDQRGELELRDEDWAPSSSADAAELIRDLRAQVTRVKARDTRGKEFVIVAQVTPKISYISGARTWSVKVETDGTTIHVATCDSPLEAAAAAMRQARFFCEPSVFEGFGYFGPEPELPEHMRRGLWLAEGERFVMGARVRAGVLRRGAGRLGYLRGWNTMTGRVDIAWE